MLAKICQQTEFLYFIVKKYNEGTRPYGLGGEEGSSLALTIFSKGT